ncbi:P-loop containing nucleoside triphosphate hydrolase protein [Mycena crocata]|nr:P-loop containing nucleoside triphosphate hydrolase protein [Mycena crocata]
MQGITLWARCRPRIAHSQCIGFRFRTVKATKKAPQKYPGPGNNFHGNTSHVSRSDGFKGLSGVDLPTKTILEYFRANVASWTLRRVAHDRLVAFGAPSGDVTKLLKAFTRAAASPKFDAPESIEKYDLLRLRESEDPNDADMAFSSIFFRWLAANGPVDGVNPKTTALLLRLAEAAARMYPAENFEYARKMKRKVIMHVGPTNSGKTHHALRALASAKRGVYAGPLRLLAYEIWERLNMGQIVPATATDEEIAAAATLPLSTDHPFARACNMLTGEEQKIVNEESALLSCTIEMLNLYTPQLSDVAVIDEIQMLADVERGSGWTRAVLGISASEVHLCGEETAVPLVQELLKDTGDEIVVHRYERLTPLVVEEESLGNDMTRVRKGDCIVAFSRTTIFSMKHQVEAQTGLRCAVVYGRLPPEIRSEQAALFNDPDSGYDVLIGSDAIGMGLNLKIRRIIFHAIRKFDGSLNPMKMLSVSQLKQIAGRAGRFGMNSDDEQPGGFVTTVYPEDLPPLRKTLEKSVPPLTYARLAPERGSFAVMASQLPPTSKTETVFQLQMHAGRTPLCLRHAFTNKLVNMCEYLDQQGQFTIEDKLLFTQAPFPWRETTALAAITEFIGKYYHSMHVDLVVVLQRLGYIEILEHAEFAMGSPDGRTPNKMKFEHARRLQGLEILHKILVVYLWLSFRNPVSYASYDVAVQLKERLEHVLHWCLQEITRYDGAKPEPVKPKLPPIAYKSKREIALETQELKAALNVPEALA